MEKTYTPEDVKRRFDALPADIKALVYSADMMSVLQAVGTKYQLHIDQLGTLEAETADVMTGFSEPEEFVANLKESLSIDDTKAQGIAKDISDQLFIKIRESMKKAVGASPAPAAAVPAPTTAPVPATVAPTPTPPAAAKPPTPKPDLSPADMMLQQKTVTTAPMAPSSTPPAAPVAKPEPPKPANYTADPYREPPV